ncbi:MAG: alpha/beta hydrolase [Amphiplicatus sp.]
MDGFFLRAGLWAVAGAGLAAAVAAPSMAADAASPQVELRDCSAGLRLFPSDHALIDPDLMPVLPILTTMDSGGAPRDPDISKSRERLKGAMKGRVKPPPKTPGVAMEERHILGIEDSPPVRVLVYTPEEGSGPRPGVIDIHGGAFVLGAADGGDATNRKLAKEVGAVIVSVDYRLAPEHPFPAAIHDSYAALKWLHDNASELGVDPARIAVMGGSAGGDLAASLALLARDKGEIPIKAQFLIYPNLDDRPFTALDPTCAPGTAAPVERSYVMYLGKAPGKDDVSPYAFAARAKSVAGLPPAFLAVGAVDGLAEQSLSYAHRLIQAGVPTELHVYPGAFHGFNMAAEAGVTKRFHEDLVYALRRALN